MKTSIQFSIEELQELEQLEVVAGFGGPNNANSGCTQNGCTQNGCTQNECSTNDNCNTESTCTPSNTLCPTFSANICHLTDESCGDVNCFMQRNCGK